MGIAKKGGYIEKFLKNKNKFDMVCNTLKPTFPEGLDVEIISFTALEKSWKEATKPDDRQHVTKYILENPDKFSIHNFENEEDLSYIRLTLDTKEDFSLITKIKCSNIVRKRSD